MIPVGSQWVLPTENPGWLVKRQEDICFLVYKTRKRHTHTKKNNKNTLKTEEKEKQTKPNKQRKQQTNKNNRIILLSILTNLSLKTTL